MEYTSRERESSAVGDHPRFTSVAQQEVGGSNSLWSTLMISAGLTIECFDLLKASSNIWFLAAYDNLRGSGVL